MRQRKGFTLIELLVVIAIIAILAVTIVMAVSNARTKAADAKIKSDMEEIVKINEVAFSQGGTYICCNGSCSSGWCNLTQAWNISPPKDYDGNVLLVNAPTSPLKQNYVYNEIYGDSFWGNFFPGVKYFIGAIMGSKNDDGSTKFYLCKDKNCEETNGLPAGPGEGSSYFDL